VGSEHQHARHRALQREKARDVLAERRALDRQQPLFQDDRGLSEGFSC